MISQSSTSGDDLDSLFNLPTNTVTVISGVTIDNSANGSVAVSGNSRVWGLTNAATLNGNDTGLNLGAGGTVNNQSGGRIVGGNTGLVISDGNLAVDNAGLISGNIIGISVNHSGILNNEFGGTIIGGVDGIFGFGSPQTIVNAGVIVSTNNVAILLYGGSVNNVSSGIIEGDTGVFLNGGFCYATNSGLIMGDYIGVNLFSGGSMNNLTNGVIVGGQYGVSINDSALVNNGGTIIGTNGDGVFLGNGGNVNNLQSGTILGGSSGVEIEANFGAMDNAGSIIGTNYDGVLLTGGGSVNNQPGGSIVGETYGVEIRGGGALINAGIIIGGSSTAVQLGDSGSIVTLQTGSDVRGDIGGYMDNNSAYLQGTGNYSNNFLNFESLTVQADATGWSLAGTNTFSTATEVQSGLLCINGILTTPHLTVDQSGTLGGGGFINGSVTIQPASTIAPGTTTNIATLTISSDVLLQGTAMMRVIPINTNSDQLYAGNITFGGTLLVTNLSATSPTNGANYQLFSATNFSGTFGTFNLPPLNAGLAWNWNPTNGTLSVISAPLSLQILSPQLSGTNFSFSFATTAGQRYTIWGNANLTTSNWMVVTNLTGDDLTDQVILPILPASPSRFFRVSQP